MFKFINIFGKKKADKESDKKTVIDTIHDLKAQISLLEKRKKFIDVQIANNTDAIKAKLAANNRASALILVKKNKALEEETVKIDSMCLTMEEQIMALESANINTEYFKAVNRGNQVIKSANAKTDVDSVEKLMDDMEDQRETMRTINDLLMQPANKALEDEDLLSALEEYMPKNEVAVETAPMFPSVPINNKEGDKDKDDDEQELARLTRELAM